jgi:hypothetical protein
MNKRNFLVVAGLVLAVSLHAGDPLKITPSADNNPVFKSKPILLSVEPKDDFEDEVKNIIKLNLTHLALPSIHLQYERVFHKNMSGALGFSYMFTRQFPNLLVQGATEDDQFYKGTTLGHWSITPEFRYYPGAKEEHNTPHGFYAGAYFRYEKYTMVSQYEESFTSSKSKATMDLTATYGGGTFGLLIGSQFRITKHFYFDWWILGYGIGAGSFDIEGKATGIALTPAEQAEVKETVEDQFGAISVFGGRPVVTVTANSVKATVALPIASIRFMGLCLGYAF